METAFIRAKEWKSMEVEGYQSRLRSKSQLDAAFNSINRKSQMSLPGSCRSSPLLINKDKEIQSPKNDYNRVNIVEVPEGMDFQRQKAVADKGEQPKLRGKIGKEKKKKEEDFPELPNFSLELRQEEISEDIYGMTGRTASRTVKKREKNVQKQIEVIFPGGSLKEITIDKYKVSAKPRFILSFDT